jgi:hypothetical protein
VPDGTVKIHKHTIRIHKHNILILFRGKTAFEELRAPVNKKEPRIVEQLHAYTPKPHTSIQSWDCLPVIIFKGSESYSK